MKQQNTSFEDADSLILEFESVIYVVNESCTKFKSVVQVPT